MAANSESDRAGCRAVPHDPDYERFIQETGFQFERDLDEAAFAVHYPALGKRRHRRAPHPSPVSPRSSLAGSRANASRAYLHKIAGGVEDYHSADIYSIPLEGRTVRVAVLNVDSVAVSNHDDPAVIRGIIDRSHKLASPFGGPALLRQYYKSLPGGEQDPAGRKAGVVYWPRPAFRPMNWAAGRCCFEKPAAVVVSAYYPVYSPSLALARRGVPRNEDDAQGLTDKVSNYLTLFHAAEIAVATRRHGSGREGVLRQPEHRTPRQSGGADRCDSAGFPKKVVGEPPQESPAASEGKAMQPEQSDARPQNAQLNPSLLT